MPESIQDMTRLRKYWLDKIIVANHCINNGTNTFRSILLFTENLQVYWNEIEGKVPESICGLMEYKLSDFKADCSGDNPQLECTCCTQCYA